jgi:hypothetical protein
VCKFKETDVPLEKLFILLRRFVFLDYFLVLLGNLLEDVVPG